MTNNSTRRTPLYCRKNKIRFNSQPCKQTHPTKIHDTANMQHRKQCTRAEQDILKRKISIWQHHRLKRLQKLTASVVGRRHLPSFVSRHPGPSLGRRGGACHGHRDLSCHHADLLDLLASSFHRSAAALCHSDPSN